MKHVYFIKPVGMVGPIKIGCSRHPEDRLYALAKWSPIPLEIILRIPEAGHALERKIHHYFADLHSHKEWFQPSVELLGFIEALKVGREPLSLLDPMKPVGSIHISKDPVERERKKLLRSYRARVNWMVKKVRRRTGVTLLIPKEVSSILRQWTDGYPHFQPSTNDLAALDAFLSSPMKVAA